MVINGSLPVNHKRIPFLKRELWSRTRTLLHSLISALGLYVGGGGGGWVDGDEIAAMLGKIGTGRRVPGEKK